MAEYVVFRASLDSRGLYEKFVIDHADSADDAVNRFTGDNGVNEGEEYEAVASRDLVRYSASLVPYIERS